MTFYALVSYLQVGCARALPVGKITIEDPKKCLKEIEWKGKPVVKGRVLFKGRAVEKLVEGLPRKPWIEFDKCLDEDFSNQSRVHIDPFGYVHVCQGITIGNMKQTAIAMLFLISLIIPLSMIGYEYLKNRKKERT